LKCFTYIAAGYPRTTVCGIAALSLGLLVAGLATNFRVETDNYDLWPPHHSLSVQHMDWYLHQSHLNFDPVQVEFYVHSNGKNVLSQRGVERVFEVIQQVTEMEHYQQGCAYAELFGDAFGVGQCHITSVAQFWNESYASFVETVETDEDAIRIMSSPTYPSGKLVDERRVLGNAQRQQESLLLTSAQSYLITFGIPWSNVTLDFVDDVLDKMLNVREEWEQQPDETDDGFRLEMQSHYSYNDEFLRSIVEDLWLMPVAFFVMCGFTVFFAFGKCHRVYSRGLLGVGAVLCIVLSVMTTYGVLFLCGVPFTTVTTIIPFLMFGKIDDNKQQYEDGSQESFFFPWFHWYTNTCITLVCIQELVWMMPS
jgi:predicted RND superfamily exporter protein